MLLCSTEHNKKNWVTINTIRGAQASAIIYSLTETAGANEEIREKCVLSLKNYIDYVGVNDKHYDECNKYIEKYGVEWKSDNL